MLPKTLGIKRMGKASPRRFRIYSTLRQKAEETRAEVEVGNLAVA